MDMWIVLGLLALGIASGQNMTQCQTDVTLLTEMNYSSHAVSSKMISYTGAGINQMGLFTQCQKNVGPELDVKPAHYCLIRFSSVVQWGVCLPKSCGPADIPDAVEILQPSLAKLSIDSSHCGDNSVTSYSGGAIFFWILCMLLGLLIIYGTYIDLYGSSESHPLNLPLIAEEGSISPLQQNIPPPPTLGREMLLSFALSRNWHTLVHRSPTRGYKALDGLRAIAMMQIILAHTINFMMFIGVDNPKQFFAPDGVSGGWAFTYFVYSGELSVDTFFFLSGFLSALVMLKQIQKRKRLSVGLVVLHRFLRLTPAFGFVILFLYLFVPHMGTGPFWWLMTDISSACGTYWWTNLLYINNFYPTTYTDQCVPWTWYLANDFQFFIVAIIVVIVYYKSPNASWVLQISLVVMTIITTASLTAKYDLSGFTFDDPAAAQNKIYDKPYTRIAPYIMGMMTSFWFQNNKDIRFDGWKKYAMWAFSFTIMTACAMSVLGDFSPKVDAWNLSENLVYNSFSRIGWTLGLAVIVVLCISGQGGIPDKILSHWFLDPMAKLTYGAYLTHPIVIRIVYNNRVQLIHYTDTLYAMYYIAFVVLSYLAAMTLFLCVETPFAKLEALALKPRKRKPRMESVQN